MRQNLQILILRYGQTKNIISLFPTLFTNLQLPITLKLIDQFQRGLLQKEALQKEVYNQSEN